MSEAPWERRLRTPEVGSARWSWERPERLAVLSSEGGAAGVWAWDAHTGTRRRISGECVVDLSSSLALVTPDGAAIAWWADPTGDERGRWMITPFDGGPDEPLLPGLPHAWQAGISLAGDTIAVGLLAEGGTTVYVIRRGARPVVVLRDARPAGVGREDPPGEGGLSADARFLCIRRAHDGDVTRSGLVVIDLASGAIVAQLADESRPVVPEAWSPVPGDARLVVVREIEGRPRPWIWHLPDGRLEPLPLDLPGDVARAFWTPDAAALVLHHEHQAIPSLLLLDIATGSLSALVAAGGTIGDAAMRPDGEVWSRYEDGATPPAWRRSDGGVAVGIASEDTSSGDVPAGRWEPLWYEGGGGAPIQGWLMRPPGPGPHPLLLSVHGGPEWHVSDRWDPERAAYVDAGVAVFAPNYRGSTGYGPAFRDAIRGDLGFPESADLVAAVDHLVATGIADQARIALEGWSWGGYLATLGAGLHPDRWRAVVAGIPVGDYVACHYECDPVNRAWDEAMMGGSPLDVPEAYHVRNPMTYVERVRAPMLVVAGERDDRCPLGQIMTYVHALRRRGHPVELHLYPHGHHTPSVDERIRQTRLILDFLGRNLSS